MEAGLEMVRQVLSHYGKPAAEVQRFTDAVRDDLYGPMWEGGLSARYRSILGDLGPDRSTVSIEWLTVPGDSGAVERTVGDLRIRTATGAVVVAVIHGRAVDPQPGPATRLQPGDRIALLGSSEECEACRALVAVAFLPTSASPA